MTKQKIMYSVSARVSRADLLRSLFLAGEDSLQTAAELAGYQAPAKSKIEFNLPELPQDLPKVTQTTSFKKAPPAETKTSIHYYQVIDNAISELLPQPSQDGKQYPDWYYQIPKLDIDSIKPADINPPAKQPIIPWAKLWPVLQALLSEFKRSRQPDMPRLARILANAEIPVRIPRQVRQSWTAEVQLLIDRPERTELFNDDYNRLLEQLQLLRGNTGLQVQQIIQRPGGVVRIRQFKSYHKQSWRMPQAGSAIVILSDLGLLDSSEQALQDWLRFGKRLRNAGFVATVLLPLPQRYLTPELISLFACVCWTRHSDLQPVRWVVARQKTDDSPLQQDAKHAAMDLLAWLSPAVRVEPALLRAVSHCLPATVHNAGVEAAVWLHDDVKPTNIGFYYKPESIEKHRRRFKQLAQQNPVLANTIVGLLRIYHAHVFPSQLHEEMLILAELMGDKLGDEYTRQIQAAKLHWRQLLKALNEKAPGTSGLPGFTWHYFKRQHQAMRHHLHNQHLPAMQGVMLRDYGPAMEKSLPEGDEVTRLVMEFANRQDQAQCYVLCQRNRDTLQLCSQQQYLSGTDGFTMGSLLATVWFKPQFILQQMHTSDGSYRYLDLQLTDDSIDINLEQTVRHELHIAGQVFILERFVKPGWAIAVSCRHDTLTVTSQSADKTVLWYWHPPEIGGNFTNESLNSENPFEPAQNYTLPGFWYDRSPKDSSGQTPDWADTVIHDQYGLYAEVSIAGVVQRFRWIQPGSFQMGSPETEKGRYDNETLHQVNFSLGFWMADTTCTQSLWQAVMSNNPSQFKGENRPVENISWNDVQQFLNILNEQHPGLNLRLPSESEWEYACRAGTTGAFNFEGDLSLTKINYRGTWEYETDKWDEGGLQETAAVKTYPANGWGLYEIHGNVWEWCKDWYGEYPPELVTDPLGSETGVYRVLRGGSWIDYGRDCRSAYRDYNSPDLADGSIGFRLARGHQSGQASSGAVQQPDVSRAAAARGAQPGDGMRDAYVKSSTKQNKIFFDNIKDLFNK